ncbi:MAG: HD domain-containing protein [Lachnospiraceae bacterium]|nr:HD domain-containing protein [Lachnospiraceae bacterium]
MSALNMELVAKAENFLKDKFDNSDFLNAHPADKEYRLQHSYRVANIGKAIAEKEGFDVTEAVIACLLHDIAYCLTFDDFENDWKNHGRNGAKIARPFLESLGLPTERVDDICYGIAIHVDDEAGFEGERTAFAETVGDADNIDRFDAYRIYEGLQYRKFSEMPYAEKKDYVDTTLSRLAELREMKLGTASAKELWQERVDYNISFYEKLKSQLNNSTEIL